MEKRILNLVNGDYVRCIFLSLIMILAPLSGCFGEEVKKEPTPELTIRDISSATRGQYMTIEVDSTVDGTFNRSNGLFYVDAFGVARDSMEMTFPSQKKSLELLLLDSERETVDISITAGDNFWNASLILEDSSELMLVDLSLIHI